ncbi:MAG TPA: adenosine deaminase [Actinomycetes bacterium]
MPGTAAAPTAESLRRLPKAELHLHLDGSLRPATVEELARELGLVDPDAPAGAAMRRVRVTRRAGLLEALAGFELLLPLLRDRGRLARVTRELVEDLAADGVVYAELRFCPRLLAGDGFGVDEVLEVAAAAAAEAEAATGTSARLIACMMGGVEPEWNRPVLEAAVRAAGAGVVAVDLAGPVEGRSPAWVDAHARLFEQAREAGLQVTVHAGEAEPPEAVRTAVDRYGATRVGHATSLVADPELLAEVVERGVTLEVCPRSNYWTHAPEEMPGLADHPIGRLLAAGAKACVNTDDRSLFGNDLSSELAEVAAAQGFGSMDLAAVMANAFWGAFDPDAAAMALGAASGKG